MSGKGAASGPELAVGDELELDIGPVAHGGACVARVGGAGGRVVFVRYALPDERAVVRITEVKPRSFCRGEAVRIIIADPRRVTPPCAHFGPGGCGGCDFQHASADLQRELKASVVAEQLRRLAHIDIPVTVEELPGGGFGWRSRVRWAVDAGAGAETGRDTAADTADMAATSGGADSACGPRRYRSHDVVPISVEQPCLIAADGISSTIAARQPPPGATQVTVVRQNETDPVVRWMRGGRVLSQGQSASAARAGRHGKATVVEQVNDRRFTVAETGFWQAHEHAAQTLSDAVAHALEPLDLSGAVAWDLYGGVGLFAEVLAHRVGNGGVVVTVESDRTASRLAARNLANLPQVTAQVGRVDRVIPMLPHAVDAVVLDPPRSGAGARVCQMMAERAPSVIVYVACDPAALARDIASLADAGYRLDGLRAFDAFPQTHHVECVARLVPGSAGVSG